MLQTERINPKSKIELQILCDLIIEFYNEVYIDALGKEIVSYILSFVEIDLMKERIILDGYELFFIKDNKNIVGFYELKKENNVVLITKFYILKEKRNNGFAKLTLKSIINENKTNEILVCVNEKLLKSQEFFIKQNFIFQKRIAKYIGEDYFVYENVLKFC